MWTTILDLVDVGAQLLLLDKQDAIKNQVLSLRTKYAEEINKDDADIDDAQLYSLKLELRNLVSVYSAAVQESLVPASTKSTG